MLRKFWSGIRGKLLFLALLPVFGSAIQTYLTFNRADRMSSSIETLTQNVLPSIETMAEIRKARNASRQWFWSGVVHAQDEKARLAAVEKATTEYNILVKNFDNYSKTPFVGFEQEEFPKLKALFPEYETVFKKISDNIKLGTPESLAQATYDMDHRYLEIGVMISAYCDKVVKFYNDTGHEQSEKTQSDHAQLKSANIWTSIISTSILFVITFLMSEYIVKQVSSVSTDLAKTGQQVRESIEQLSKAGVDLSHSSTSAAASLEETVASLEEMSSMVKMNSDNAKQAAQLSQVSYLSAEKGEQEIQHLISSMKGISQSSKRIEEITTVIDDIAFQTNLLALNAAVEAARAGEQGKGFAVVADAVRGLAQRSASAAKDISVLIKESVDKIDSGTQIADKSGAVLTEIVTAVKKVSDINNEIAEASSQQATGLQQINKAMGDLDQSSQNNAASAEQIASTSSEIQNQASVVEHDVAHLNTIVLGKRAENMKVA
ncbi:methyl-accepting chemotaxis protein [Bdellovibrio sp. HCB209]|uniref:HAMP domain-containing methyl-accepting chemotaxis protein n=1 Tax=Bdellovibrio sp. HCB209 TaxID=3394354 RepID=UPI0039B66B83